MAFEVDLTGGRNIESAEKMEESAFAATAGAGDGDDFSWENFQSDAAQGIHAGFACLV